MLYCHDTDRDLGSIDDTAKEQGGQNADQQEDTDNSIDEDILQDNDGGISMEIGSENEDNILEFDSDEANDDKCSIEEDQTEIGLENSANKESNMMVTDPSLENTTSSITVEISSDNEDDVDDKEGLGENGCGIKKHGFDDKIQFEDSNSNGNSGKINDTVNFLNHDLSGTKSPLTTGKDYSNSKNVENDVLMEPKDKDAVLMEPKDKDAILMETKDKDAGNEDDMDCAEEKIIENTDTAKDENISESIVQDETHNCAENDKAECVIAKTETSVVVKEDGPSISLLHLKPTFKTDLIKDDQVKDFKNENAIVTKDGTHECNTDEKDEIDSKGEINDEDDDVIFEGETKPTMPPMRHEFKHLTPSLKIDRSSSVVNSMNTDKSNIANMAAEDSDVIFEKETKAEDIKSKQNCDTLKTNSDINTAQKVDIIASSPTQSHIDSKTSNSENIANTDESTVQLKPSSGSSDRKRSADDKELGENESKRSRLDLTGLIGKLGSRVEPASIEVSDSDDEDERSVLTDTVSDKVPDVTEKNLMETCSEKNQKMIAVTEQVCLIFKFLSLHSPDFILDFGLMAITLQAW